MIRLNPLEPEILFHLGPIAITRTVVTTWVIMAGLTLLSWASLRRATVKPGFVQAALEILVETISTQIGDIIKKDAAPYLPLIGTFFIFILCSNLISIIPGMKPPTARLETTAALSGIVFFSVHYFGIRARGLKGYLAHYIKPNPLLLPLNIIEEVTRVFALMVRLFGNVMSHELILAIIVFLAGLFVPIPFILLGIMIGIIQAYIFAVLSTVFIGAVVGNEGAKETKP